MTLEAKICGISTPETMAAAVTGGARYVGLVFYPPSPRSVTPQQAGGLVARVPEGVLKVGLMVDPDDALIESVLAAAKLDLLQLHGDETPARVADIRARFEVPVMKTIKVTSAGDLAAVEGFLPVAARLLFDAKVPKTLEGALPGGNAVSFDWKILAGRKWSLPWMLAGGLKTENLAEAVGISGAGAVDVSSGVEDGPGRKNPEKITAFLAAARAL